MEKRIGKVTHYFNRIGVAVLELEDGLKVGDTIHISGRRTNFKQEVESLEVDHQKMTAVGAGADAALKVDEPVHDGDVVYAVTGQRTQF
jgi:hypothetical protein